MKKTIDERIPEKITKPATADSIPLLLEFVSSQVFESGMPEERVQAISLGVEEVLNNILEFSCPEGKGEITISCEFIDSGALLIHIWDTGKPFNMLLAGTFPEVEAISGHEKIPSTKMLKRAVKNIEYIRGTNKNILILTIPPLYGRR